MLELLQTLGGGVVADQIFENREDVLPVLNHTFQNRTKLRLALRFPVPLGKDCSRDADVAAQLVGRVTAEEEAVEKCRLSLRELEVLQGVV